MAAPSLRITNKRVYGFMLFFGCRASIFYSVTAWLAPYVQSIGMNHVQSGYLLTLFTLIQIPTSLIIPILVGRTGKRRTGLLLCAIMELAGILLFIGHFSPWVATAFLGIGAGGLFPLALLLPIEEAQSVEEATSWSAQTQFGGFILGAMGPLAFGFTLDAFNRFTPALLVLLTIILLMIMTILKLENKTFKIREAGEAKL